MKKLLPILFLGFALQSAAQAPFSVMDSIDANNINALVLVHGDMWWDPATSKPHCEFPKGSKKHLGFASSLWLSGYDDAGQLHVAAQTYRQDGNDYWPGPLDAAGTLNYTTSEKWAKIWKVSRSEINAFNSIVFHTVANTPESILRWPGRGSDYAQGKDGTPLVITEDMAPFVDRNGDGKYQPLKGDYPDIRGEQALWWIFSDNGPTHSQTDANPLKVQVHAMAYAYRRGTLIDNVVYYDYTIVNKSPNNYHDFRLALWDDVDLGYYLDDFASFDSTRRMGVIYNGTNNDGGAAGNPSNSYGKFPPARGVTLISLPEDEGTNYAPPGSYMYYNYDPSILGNPIVDTHFNHYMRSRMQNGAHLQYEGRNRNYIFSDDPSIPGGWSECGFGNPGDRRFVLASNDFNVAVGERKKVVMALVVRDSAGGCPDVDLSGVKEVADTAWKVYYNPPPPLSATQTDLSAKQISIYPNPAHDLLYIDCSSSHVALSVSIYNIVGQRMGAIACRAATKNTIDISGYPPGIYFVRYNGADGGGEQMIVKE